MKEMNTHTPNTPTRIGNEKGGIVIPAVLWWLGMPLAFVLVLWLLFFRG